MSTSPYYTSPHTKVWTVVDVEDDGRHGGGPTSLRQTKCLYKILCPFDR